MNVSTSLMVEHDINWSAQEAWLNAPQRQVTIIIAPSIRNVVEIAGITILFNYRAFPKYKQKFGEWGWGDI